MANDSQICVIEPRPDVAPALAALVSGYGLQVTSFRDTDTFCRDKACNNLSCVLLDIHSAGLDAPQAFRELRERGFSGAIIALTADNTNAPKLRAAGATDVISRPLVAAYLLTRVGDLLPGARELPELDNHTIILGNGAAVTYRLMRPEDADIEQDFVRALSDRSRYLRFFSWLKELPPYMLDALTHPEFPVSYAIIATVDDNGREKQIAVGRYAPTGETGIAEYAVVVADDWQGQGIATQLMQGIILACSISGFSAIDGLILKENAPMIGLARKLGFDTVQEHEEGPGVIKLRKQLHLPDTISPAV